MIQHHLPTLSSLYLRSKEDDVEEIPDEITRLLEHEEKIIQPHLENLHAWSYEDMPGLDNDIVQHFLPLKPECVPVKQKLRRTHHDMAVKIKEEVQKQIDAGFLVTSTYP
ncbi:hypothetical protein KIW84_072962 [Lathyrus oleraceus]|uniref:Uncharacterized protein n=1 Tax=Pisum sativum TaxID=3888 RepID=A0A9D4ZV07_PEA|nr:hypothetical protein KIW84_072962 [Pisum sativum]